MSINTHSLVVTLPLLSVAVNALPHNYLARGGSEANNELNVEDEEQDYDECEELPLIYLDKVDKEVTQVKSVPLKVAAPQGQCVKKDNLTYFAEKPFVSRSDQIVIEDCDLANADQIRVAYTSSKNSPTLVKFGCINTKSCLTSTKPNEDDAIKLVFQSESLNDALPSEDEEMLQRRWDTREDIEQYSSGYHTCRSAGSKGGSDCPSKDNEADSDVCQTLENALRAVNLTKPALQAPESEGGSEGKMVLPNHYTTPDYIVDQPDQNGVYFERRSNGKVLQKEEDSGIYGQLDIHKFRKAYVIDQKEGKDNHLEFMKRWLNGDEHPRSFMNRPGRTRNHRDREHRGHYDDDADDDDHDDSSDVGRDWDEDWHQVVHRNRNRDDHDRDSLDDLRYPFGRRVHKHLDDDRDDYDDDADSWDDRKKYSGFLKKFPSVAPLNPIKRDLSRIEKRLKKRCNKYCKSHCDHDDNKEDDDDCDDWKKRSSLVEDIDVMKRDAEDARDRPEKRCKKHCKKDCEGHCRHDDHNDDEWDDWKKRSDFANDLNEVNGDVVEDNNHLERRCNKNCKSRCDHDSDEEDEYNDWKKRSNRSQVSRDDSGSARSGSSYSKRFKSTKEKRGKQYVYNDAVVSKLQGHANSDYLGNKAFQKRSDGSKRLTSKLRRSLVEAKKLQTGSPNLQRRFIGEVDGDNIQQKSKRDGV